MEPWKAVKHIKSQLQIPDAQDSRWKLSGNGSGISATSPLSSGIGFHHHEPCIFLTACLVDEYDDIMESIAAGFEAEKNTPGSGHGVLADEFDGTCGAWCFPWTTYSTPTQTGCSESCAYSSGPFWNQAECAAMCWFECTVTRTWQRTATKTYYDCTTCTWTQTGSSTEEVMEESVAYLLSPCSATGYTCPAVPDDLACDNPATGSPGGWTPGSCPNPPGSTPTCP